MTRIHDVGGKRTTKPIDVAEDETPFKADWEGRAWGINEALEGHPGWTLDWWRYVRELIPAEDYLTRPYFDQWMQVYAAMMVDSDVASVAEIASGKAQRPKPNFGQPMGAGDVARISRIARDFRRPATQPPIFAVGDAVHTKTIGGNAHTRLPGYAMDKTGTVHALRGNHLLPDAGARGEEVAEPLYTIAFKAADLWPEAKGRRDTVFVDLWESYFERR
nr:SH3-like domain-containing protein [uncultured Dongia sp.]